MTMTLSSSTSFVLDCGPPRSISRSVSWNSSGYYLAVACSDRMARLYTIDHNNNNTSATGGSNSVTDSASTTPQQQQANTTGSAREVLVISGHTAPVTKVRFHPNEPSTLCTAAADQTIRLWDCRQASQKSRGMIEIQNGKAPVSMEWCGKPAGNSNNHNNNNHNLVVTEVNGKISVYDTRQLSASASSSAASAAVYVFDSTDRRPNEVVETTMFSPDGNHLIAAVTRDGMGDLDVWNWKESSSVSSSNNKTGTTRQQAPPVAKKRRVLHYPAHTGPIYAMDISPNGSRLATGGWDALVGLWDTTIKSGAATTTCANDNGDQDYFLNSGINNFICTHTIRRRIKFFRTVAFSHDGKLLASSTEENDVDIAQADTGASVGLVNIACGQQQQGGAAGASAGGAAAASSMMMMQRRGGGGGGAEEVAWHPKDYILASARIDSPYGASPLTPVAVAKLNVV